MYTECSEIDSQSRAFGETNDCTVRAITAVTGLPYGQVHKVCAEHGRRKRRGMYDYQWKAAIRALGYDLIDRTDEVRRAGGKTTRTVVNCLPTRPHIVWSYRHLSGWTGTKLLDWADGRLKRVQRVFEVVRTDGKPNVQHKGRPTRPTTPKAPRKPRKPRTPAKPIDALLDMLGRGPVTLYAVRTVYGATDKEARSLLGRARTALRKNGMDLVLAGEKTWEAR